MEKRRLKSNKIEKKNDKKEKKEKGNSENSEQKGLKIEIKWKKSKQNQNKRIWKILKK